MIALVMVFMLICGAVAQMVLPRWAFLGLAVFPILPALILYYALARSYWTAMMAALGGGLLQDAAGMVPLGYSSICFCILVWVISKFRSEFYARSLPAQIVLGLASNVCITFLLYLFLRQGGYLLVSWRSFLWKLNGALWLGAVVTPVVFFVADFVDRKLGMANVKDRP